MSDTPTVNNLAHAFAADPVGVSAQFNKGFGEFLGIEFTEVIGHSVRAKWTIRPDMHQFFGLLHGGIYCSVIETLASIGAVVWLDGKGHAVGVNNSTDFLRATREGTLFAHALPIHQGRSQQLWLVNIADEKDRLVARGQVRLQNILDGGAGLGK